MLDLTKHPKTQRSAMPDIAAESNHQHQGTLNWVGMSEIQMPLLLVDEQGVQHHISASLDAFVSLDDAEAKGIHMSRLYLALEQLSTEGQVSLVELRSLLQTFLVSHQELSQAAKLVCRFDYHLRRPSLVSGKTGWKAYPIEIHAELQGDKFQCIVQVDVAYSSTCPCSAALARQLIQETFKAHFQTEHIATDDVVHWLGSSQGIVATPHSQRSVAEIKVALTADAPHLPLQYLVDAAEQVLKTPVQAAVKREDEQEFARLNGQHNMFCEDAARMLKQKLNQTDYVADFWLRVNHYESLHAHNAVAVASKGISNGFQA